MGRRTQAASAALIFAATAAGHGHVANVVVNGVYYQGYGSDTFPYMSNPPKVAGWTINQPDNGFVSPDSFGASNIICHNDARPGAGHIGVKPGDRVSLQWNTWPESHKGPVIDYLAACNGDCESVDKSSLNFFKIDGPGYISGTWASDVLIKNNNTWLVEIPSVKPGNYVLRHEIIALHAAGSQNGAQAYPMCINLAISGSGSASPAGVKGTALYKATDAGILFDIYKTPLSYPVPGPTLMAGVPVSVAQSSSRATATATATLPGGGNGGGQPTSTTRPPPGTTMTTTTRPPTTTTTAAGNGGGSGQSLYGQCGGSGYSGPTACAQGTCSTLNPYYAQCLN
jgi:lytic cellulose monooxygenase (C1-hydroxylating)